MQKILRGFTIVELLVVVTILSLMAGGVTLAYISAQRDASAGQGRSLARSVVAAAERYYNKNNEYPTSTTLAGASKDLTDAEITAAATILDVRPSSLKGSSENEFKLAPCNRNTGVSCSQSNILDKQQYVYYVTRAAGAVAQVSTTLHGSGCTVTIPSGNGADAFLVTYFDPSEKEWVLYRGSKGTVNVSGSCSFS